VIAFAREHQHSLQCVIERKRQSIGRQKAAFLHFCEAGGHRVCWARPKVIRRPLQRRLSWDLTQTARSPGATATPANRAARATAAATEPDATEPAAAATAAAAATSTSTEPETDATTEPAATATAAAAAATSATTASSGFLHAPANVFLIEDIGQVYPSAPLSPSARLPSDFTTTTEEAFMSRVKQASKQKRTTRVNLISRPYARARALLARPWSARCYGVARQREGSRQNSIGECVNLIC
jgi:hypothetical protein